MLEVERFPSQDPSFPLVPSVKLPSYEGAVEFGNILLVVELDQFSEYQGKEMQAEQLQEAQPVSLLCGQF